MNQWLNEWFNGQAMQIRRKSMNGCALSCAPGHTQTSTRTRGLLGLCLSFHDYLLLASLHCARHLHSPFRAIGFPLDLSIDSPKPAGTVHFVVEGRQCGIQWTTNAFKQITDLYWPRLCEFVSSCVGVYACAWMNSSTRMNVTDAQIVNILGNWGFLSVCRMCRIISDLKDNLITGHGFVYI